MISGVLEASRTKKMSKDDDEGGLAMLIGAFIVIGVVIYAVAKKAESNP